MARKIFWISTKLSRYLNAHYKNNPVFNGVIQAKQSGIILPKVMHIAFLRGEGLFRERFFKRLEDKNISDLHSQHAIYTSLVEDKQFFRQLAEHADLITFFKIKFPDKYDVGTLSYMLYCVLLFDMENRNELHLIDEISFGFVDHFLPNLYPKTSVNTDVSSLKQELVRLIKQQWHVDLSVKESFRTDDEVEFSLYVHAKGYHPKLLINQVGKRLKPTRLNVYKKIIEQLKSPYYALEKPESVAIKKSSKIKSLD